MARSIASTYTRLHSQRSVLRWVEPDRPTGCSTICVNTGRELSCYLLHPLYRTEEMLRQGASILHEIDLIVPFEVVGPSFLAKAASAGGLGGIQEVFRANTSPHLSQYGPCLEYVRHES